MSEIIKSNWKLVKTCILYDVLRKKPVFEAFKDLSGVLGQEYLDYPMFAHVYRKLENGDQDLDSKEEPGSRCNINDMPMEVLYKIVESISIKEKWIMRKVSRIFRDIVDSSKATLTSLKITTTQYKGTVTLTFDKNQQDYKVEYLQKVHKCLVKLDDMSHTVERAHYLQLMLVDLEIILKKSKIELIDFDIKTSCSNPEAREKVLRLELKFLYFLEKILDSFNSKIHVENLLIEVANSSHLLSILDFLKPGVLKTLKIWSRKPDPVDLNIIVNLEQWKKAEKILMAGYQHFIPWQNFIHLKIFRAKFDTVEPETVIELKNKMVESSTMQMCELGCVQTFEKEKLCHLLGPPNRLLPDSAYIRHFVSATTTDIINLTFENNNVILIRFKSPS